MARGTGMRQNEIIQLEWADVDLQDGFVRLRASKTKTDEARSVRLLPDVIVMLKEIPRAIHTKKSLLIRKGPPDTLLDWIPQSSLAKHSQGSRYRECLFS